MLHFLLYNTNMLIDEAEVILSGGHGGPGKVSFGKMMGSGPDGGNGGDGGDVYVEATSDITLLNQFSAENEFAAQMGEAGGQNKRSGKRGNDLTILLPVGTSLVELETKRANDLVTSGEVIDLTEVGQVALVARGGRGGKGNWEFRSPRRTTPKFAQPGLDGERRRFQVNLKLIAQYGLIGLPNAGKSSLLNEMTNAKAKIGNYAFTTLSPNLGNLNGRIVADIPGLIEGAHEGRGLGIKFLKHIEKVEVLLHCISAESSDMKHDYEIVRKELIEYKPELAKKKEILLLTKSDTLTPAELKKKVSEAKKLNKNVLVVSIFDYDSIEELKKSLKNKKKR